MRYWVAVILFFLILFRKMPVENIPIPDIPQVRVIQVPVPVLPIVPQPKSYLTELLNLHNAYRRSNGCGELILDSYLSEYAQKHAEYMSRRNKLVHSDISVLMSNYQAAGENIAWNYADTGEVMQGWIASKGHRANILNKKFNQIGFGVAYRNGEPYWCTIFGTKKASVPNKTSVLHYLFLRIKNLIWPIN